MVDPGVMSGVSFDSFKAHLELITRFSLGGVPPDQLGLSLERIEPAIPLIAALFGALNDGLTNIKEFTREEGWDVPGRKVSLRKFLKDFETVSRLQGAMAMALAIGHFVLDESMREQMDLVKEVPSKIKSKERLARVKRAVRSPGTKRK